MGQQDVRTGGGEKTEGVTRQESTGIGRNDVEVVGHAPGKLAKGIALSAGVAADLAVVEDKREGIGEKPDHRQYHQRRGLMHGRMFEMAVGGDGPRLRCRFASGCG